MILNFGTRIALYIYLLPTYMPLLPTYMDFTIRQVTEDKNCCWILHNQLQNENEYNIATFLASENNPFEKKTL